MKRRPLIWPLLGLLVLVACPSVTMDPVVTESARVLAVFAPDAADPCNSDLPFPTDLAKDPATGTLNVPFCEGDSESTIGLKYNLRQQDGYALTTPLTFRFSRPVDPTTIANAIHVLDVSGLRELTFTHEYVEERDNMVRVTLDAPLVPASQYVVVVSNDVRDTTGQPVVADQAFTFAKSTEPLVDELGYSRYAPLDDATANTLEQMRLAYQSVFALGESVAGVPRDRVAIAWFFTTTSVSYVDMVDWALDAITGGGAEAVHETEILASEHLLLQATGLPAADICSLHTGHIELRGFLNASDRFDILLDGSALSTPISVDYVLTIPVEAGVTCEVDSGTGRVPAWDQDKLVIFTHGLGRCKNDLLALANAFAGAGWAVLSMDGPRAGARMHAPLGDQDLDGCGDQPDIPELIDSDPFVIRDLLREWALELVQVQTMARFDPGTLAGQSDNGTAPEVGLLGHSWGGLAALLAAPLGPQPVDAVVASATPGGLGPVFAPLITATMVEDMPGATQREIIEAAETGISAFNWALEPVDPLFASAVYPSNTTMPVLIQVVDTGTVPVDLHGTDAQLLLLSTFGRHSDSIATFDMFEAGGSNICEDPSGAVGALLLPCDTSSAPNEAQALAVTVAMQRQVVGLIENHVVCTPPCN